MLRTYDPKQVSMIYAGQIIEGFAEGTFILAERNEDSANLQVGSQGDATRAISNNRGGRVTITLQQTSPSNGVFDAQRLAMELAGGGVAPMLCKDAGGLELFGGAKSWVVKPPPIEFSNEPTNREWILETDFLEMAVAGQSE